MTDRLNGAVVAFIHDIREDDAVRILDAIRMIDVFAGGRMLSVADGLRVQVSRDGRYIRTVGMS